MSAVYKVVVLGTSGVGKTAIVQRLVDNTFSTDGQSTVGVEFKSQTITTDEEKTKLNIWDTAGQERFRSVSKAYFRNAVGAILVFAINDHVSFTDLDGWLDDLHKLAAPNAVIILVGNKADLEDERHVSTTQAQEYADRNGLVYIETSAKDAINVEEAFIRLTKSINQKVKNGDIQGQFESPQAQMHPIAATGTNKPNDGGCC